MLLRLQGNINDRLNSFIYVARELAPLRHRREGDRVELDLTQLRYLGPDGVCLIAGAIMEARERGVVIDVRVPNEPAPLVAFLAFSGFNRWILGTAPPESGHPDNVTVPIRQFHQSRHQDPKPIVDLINRFEPVTDDLKLSLEICVAELVQNVEDHAQSPIGALGCARFLRNVRQVRFALVDFGEGVLNTLRRAHPEVASGRQALESIARGGYSARSRRNNLGQGITNLRSIVTEAFAGNAYIVSGDAAGEFRSNAPSRYRTLDYTFGGTAVCFTLPTEPAV